MIVMSSRKTLLILVALFLGLMAVTSCKNIQNEIIGTWVFQTFDNNHEQGMYEWTFAEDGSMTRTVQFKSGVLYDSCTYVVDASAFNPKIEISHSEALPNRSGSAMYGLSDVNGLYRIDKFADNVLIMTRIKLADGKEEGAYYRCEMKRQ